MAKKSIASLSVVRPLMANLPDAPNVLTDTQAQFWRAVVATKPADWFQADSFPVLADYCRAVDMSNELAALVDSFDRSQLAEYERLKTWKDLVKMQRDQQHHVMTLATKLRLTPQSRYSATNASTASKRAGLDRPWITGDRSGTLTG